MEFTKSIVIDKSIAQLFVNPIDKSPPEKDADVKLPKLSAANVPTLFSFTLGTGPVKLLAFKLVLLTPSTISAVTFIVTGVDGEPGLETDTISNPNVFGIVIPAMLCDYDTNPPLAFALFKLYVAITALLAVFTKFSATLKSMGQLFVRDKSKLPLENVTSVKLPRLPPL